jgi:hypothetical protein
VVEQFKAATAATGGPNRDVQLVFLGCGTVGLGRSLYKRVIGATKNREWIQSKRERERR